MYYSFYLGRIFIYTSLITFLYKEIGVDYRIEFGNVHRFSHKPRGKRPIVARFLYHSDLQYVLNNAYQLRNTPYGIRQQFPKEIKDNRRKLYPIQKEAKRQGNMLYLSETVSTLTTNFMLLRMNTIKWTTLSRHVPRKTY